MNDPTLSTFDLLAAQGSFTEGSPIFNVLQGFIDSGIDKSLNANNQNA